MKRSHIIVFAILLGGLLVLWALGYFKQSEGFAAVKSKLPSCPAGYTFFNGPNGDSFCCGVQGASGGNVNPYTHKCEDHTRAGDGNLCAFVPTKDPLDPSYDLPLCSSVNAMQQVSGSAKCPTTMPNWVADGFGSEKCCRSASENGLQCAAADIAENAYCILAGRVGAGEKRCDEVSMLDGATCPNASFVKFTYPLDLYGDDVPSAAKGLTMPVCSRVNETCIPDSAVQYMQTKGVFKDNTDLANWKWACGSRTNKNADDATYQFLDNKS